MRKAHWPIGMRRETDAVRDMQSWLKFRAGVWKTHDGKHPPAHRGISDLVFCWPLRITQEMIGRLVGLFGVVEAKRPGVNVESALREKQREFLEDVATHHGIVVKATSWEDVERALKLRALV